LPLQAKRISLAGAEFEILLVADAVWGARLPELYRYAAFVSYASKDAKFAKALHQRLERYNIPRKLGTFDLTGGGKKNRIYPVFRDREELPAGDLGANLEAALRASNALIVVCSPNAAMSPWVEKEILYFISLGRADRIFAIITDTAPVTVDGKDATRISFPRPFRPEDGGSLELVAADARKGKDGFRNAWLKIIAGLIQVNAGDLQDRDQKRRQSRRLLVGSGLTAATASAGIAAWAMVLPHHTYAKEYTRVFGVWSPVTPISASEASARKESYRFVRRGAMGPIINVDRVNGQGNCPTFGTNPIVSLTGDEFSFDCNTARACSAHLTYYDGLLTGEEIRDQFGNKLEQVKYSSGGAQAIREEAVIGCSRVGNGIKFVTLDRSATGSSAGQDTEVKFYAAPGEPAPNKAYAYGYRYEFDNARRLIRKTALGANGQPAPTIDGWTTIETLRDRDGEIAEIRLKDAAGAPVTGSDGWAVQESPRDSAGNIISTRHYSAEGRPVLNADGVFEIRQTVDEAARLTTRSSFDTNGAPTNSSFGYSRVEWRYDDAGHTYSGTYFDADGRPAVGSGSAAGCHILRYLRADRGDMVGWRCYNQDTKPVLGKGRNHLWKIKIDRYGNRIEESFYGVNDEPVLDTDGVHLITFEWRASGPGSPVNQRVKSSNYGTALEPVVWRNKNSGGFHQVLREYDSKGFLALESFLGIDGEADRDRRGAFGYRYGNDSLGNVLEKTPVGPDAQPIDLPGQLLALKRDQYGREIERSYYDASGQRAVFNRHWRNTLRYDSMARIIEFRKYNTDDEPLESGLALEERAYDAWGRVVRTTYKDASGKISPGPAGAAIAENSRDVRGNIVEWRYYGPDGKPVLGHDGWSVQRRSIDTLGRDTGGMFFGVDGEPVEDRSGRHGWRNTYDGRGNRVEYATLGVDGHPKAITDGSRVAIYKYQYDARDLLVRSDFFDGSGQRATDDHGKYGFLNELDDRGDAIAQVNLGPDGTPAPDRNGVLRFEFDLGPRGETVEERVFGGDGLPRSDSYFRLVRQHDRLGNETEFRLYDKHGDLVLSAATGRAIVKSSYNALGKLIAEAAFGTEGEPVDRTDLGWHRKDIQYTDAGAWVADVCARVDNTVVPCK
jgi:MTH538 TIR-like domain (DUF1863)